MRRGADHVFAMRSDARAFLDQPFVVSAHGEPVMGAHRDIVWRGLRGERHGDQEKQPEHED